MDHTLSSLSFNICCNLGNHSGETARKENNVKISSAKLQITNKIVNNNIIYPSRIEKTDFPYKKLECLPTSE